MVISKAYIKNSLYNNALLWKIIEFFQGLNFAISYLFYYKLALRKDTSIREINIEFSSECNLRCTFCALDHNKEKAFLEKQTLIKLFDELKDEKRFSSVERIQLYNGGETLLHPEKFDLLAIIKEYKEAFLATNRVFPQVVLLTNATLLRERQSKTLIDLDIVDEVLVSLDGGSPESFEKFRVRAKWPMFYRNIKDFLRYKKEVASKIKLRTISIIPEDKPFTLDWMHPEFREILEAADTYELRRLHNWAGEVALENKDKKHKIGCSLLMKQMVVLPNGDVTVCCSDLNSRGVIGNLKKESLISVYESKKRLSWLHSLLLGRKADVDLCKNCETF
ncbi:MAG: radical SAM protein [Chitinophagales bacterium]